MKTQNLKIVSKLGLITLILSLMVPAVKAWSSNEAQLQAFGIDTVAGYSTLLTTTKIDPNQSLTFLIKKPDGVIVSLESKTDNLGYAKLSLPDVYTQQPGKYYVGAKIGNYVSTANSFMVYANKMGMGGPDGFADIFQVAKAQQFGSVNNFDFTDLPDPILLNKDISFKIVARDQNNATVQNYTGTIHFSSDGDNAANVTLPEDYTFKAEDLGVHEFSLGLKFTANGIYKIVVTDVNNQLVKVEKYITVGGSGNQFQPDNQLKNTVVYSPTAGSYSQNVQSVIGTAPNGSMVNIFDNDQKIGSVQTNPDGSYTYQTTALADGIHKIYAVSVDSNNAILGTSDTSQIMIDTTPPVVDEFDISPTKDITANSVMSVKVVSEDSLQSASIVINSNIIQLTPSLDQSGSYVGSLQAPSEPGDYPIDVILVDQLGNQGSYKGKATVSITADGGSVITQEVVHQSAEQTQETVQALTDLPPSQVIGLVAYGSNNRVTLVWEPATDDKMVKNYRVYYGLDAANLTDVVNTKESKATWYVPNLANGKEYYFAVTALDTLDQESPVKSEVASAIPFDLEVNAVLKNVPTQSLSANNSNYAEQVLLRNAALEDGYVPLKKAEPGPELAWFVFGSGSLSALLGFSKKKSNK